MSRRRLGRFWWFILVSLTFLNLIILYFFGLDALFGGLRSVDSGRSYGFEIGMSKTQVLARYLQLERNVNIRAYQSNAPQHIVIDRAELSNAMPTFVNSDHWKAYRSRFPLYYQEFHFSNGALAVITNYIRFVATP